MQAISSNMAYKIISFTVLLSLLCGHQVLADLNNLPENLAVMAGQTIILTCSSNNPPPTARVMWTEFSSSPLGMPVSDNRGIVPTHPNADRYAIVGDDLQNEFNLQITDVRKEDGGMYLCQDVNGGPPNIIRWSAELIVFESEPACRDYATGTGNVLENINYIAECEVNYRGNLHPKMQWFGPPGTFYTNGTNPPGSVWSYLGFTATRDLEGEHYYCQTNFTEFTAQPGYASNIPDYLHIHTGPTLVVNWPPNVMSYSPVKDFYEVGDVLTCTADSKPESSYQWTNLRTNTIAPPGPMFTITPDMEGFSQVMRCQASVIIEAGFYTNDILPNITVPLVTTTTTTLPTTTTEALPDAPCGDLSGRWVASNPAAILCIEVDRVGNLFTLIRNGTDLFFGTGRGKTVVNDYKHLGFTTLWPLGGAGAFSGECHKCFGTEVILMSGLSRNKVNSPACGVGSETQLTNLYVFTRTGDICLGETVDEVRTNQPWILEKMGVKAKKIVPL